MGGKGICLHQFSMILFNPDTNLATKPNSGTGLPRGIWTRFGVEARVMEAKRFKEAKA